MAMKYSELKALADQGRETFFKFFADTETKTNGWSPTAKASAAWNMVNRLYPDQREGGSNAKYWEDWSKT